MYPLFLKLFPFRKGLHPLSHVTIKFGLLCGPVCIDGFDWLGNDHLYFPLSYLYTEHVEVTKYTVRGIDSCFTLYDTSP